MTNKPWENEPDRVEFRYKGFPCLIVRNQGGSLCGYAGVPPSHSLHGKTCHSTFPESNFDKKIDDIEIHGGVTFTGACQEDGPICHKPEPGEPDNVWWVGFDCAHYGDFMPHMDDPDTDLQKSLYPDEDMRKARAREKLSYSKYRNIAYVKNEIRRLVKQLEKAA